MINVELNDVLDVILNIPNAVYTFYFQSKACNIKYKKTYIIGYSIVILLLSFLQNIEVLSQEIHAVATGIMIVFATQLFVEEKRLSALQFCIIMYLTMALCEAMSYVVCFILFGESSLIMVKDIRNMVYIKVYFAIICLVAEYAVYRIWIGRVDKITKTFNKGILIVMPVELILAWCALWVTFSEPQNSNAAAALLASLILTVMLNIFQFMIGEQDIRKQSELVKAHILKEQLANQNNRKNELEEHINKADEAKAYILDNVDRAAAFLAERQGEAAHEQLQDIVDTISVKYLYSNNKIADALISDKAKLCEKYGINLNCRLDFSKELPIDNARLCIVLSNLIDNAIRACRELTESSTAEHKPFISLKVNEQFGYLVIRQENSFNGIVENRRSGVFSEHGLGLEIIKSITDELNGELVTEHDDKVFVTSVGVPLS